MNPPSVVPPPGDSLEDLAQRCHLLLETLHVVVYFAVEPREAFAACGLPGRAGYFAGRSAAMGAVKPEVVAATFAVFAPDFVGEKMAGIWDSVTPQQVLDARRDAVAATLHRVVGEPDVTRAVELARTACRGLRPDGRPVYAAHAALPWPAEVSPAPADGVLDLWHAATLLREHRGDGHVAALTMAGLHPIEALILHGHATATMPFLRQTRGWSPESWEDTAAQMRGRGWLTDVDGVESVTEAGRSVKLELERATRAAALAGWRHLGEQGCQELVAALTPLRAALMASDVFPPGSPLKPQR
ncbi:MAG: hypothetical protein M3140_07420 [Actinomycetota bacterium]|nr:hypothetical protein [Actinomycetota bacterium]